MTASTRQLKAQIPARRQVSIDHTATCIECDSPVRAIDGEMEANDLRSIQRGGRPRYAQHAVCARKGRR